MTPETSNALNQVSEGRKMVLSKLTDITISHDEKQVLGKVLIILQEQEDILINSVLKDMVDKINASNEELKNLIQQMDNASQNISEISNTIKKISNVLSTLTEITARAISAGLLS